MVNIAIVYIVDAFEIGFKSLNIRSNSIKGHTASGKIITWNYINIRGGGG